MTPGLTLLDAFDVDISGREFKQGKPHPEIFLTAASELGVEPSHTFVIEDAESGIQAAKAGAFAALGVARHDDAALLERAHADIVVTSLDEISLEGLAEGRLERRAA
jgi:beta-phosphoglucomutase-like phosphatase (HAD superfamily)